MPELPEVQTIVDDLNKKIIGRKITAVWFDAPKMISIIFADRRGKVHGTTRKTENFRRIFEKELSGLKIEKIERRGKNILIYLTDAEKRRIFSAAQRQVRHGSAHILLVHQKMTGHLLVGRWKIQKIAKTKFKVTNLGKGPLQEKVNDYIHLIFDLDNGQQLALSDLRKFAKVLFGSKEEIEKSADLAKIGPDPMDKNFKGSDFIKSISRQKRKIKQVLLDQNVISGIGNIYSDEALFLAKIHPFRPANKIAKKELKNLYSAIKNVLKKAIKLRGTSISDFRDTSGEAGSYGQRRLVYRKESQLCGRCKTPIKRIKMGGRSAHFCPHCQKL